MTWPEVAGAALDRYIERVLGSLDGRAWASVEETTEWLGLGRSSGYEAIRRGELPALHVGHRLVVPVPVLVAMLLGVPRHTERMAALLDAKVDQHDAHMAASHSNECPSHRPVAIPTSATEGGARRC